MGGVTETPATLLVGGKAVTDPALRRELAEAEVTRSELLLQAIRLIQASLARSPKSPLADEASLALVGAFLELGDDEAVVKLSARFAKLYPKSTFLDSFQYSEALGDFHLGRYDRAFAVAEAIATATYKDADGVQIPRTVTQKVLTQQIVVKMTDIKHNVDLPADTFKRPAAADEPAKKK